MSGLMFPKVKRQKKASKRWYGKTPKKAEWKEPRTAALRENCEKCGKAFVRSTEPPHAITEKRHVDHIAPERLILKLCSGADPHHFVNLWCLCGSCHGVKTSADRLLCKGDKMGYLRVLRTANFPMHHIESALAHYGF